MSKQKKRKSLLSRSLKKIFDFGVFLLIVLIIVYLLSTYVIERITIHNVSMEPTVSSEDVVFVDKISYRFKNPKRFDIIVFKQGSTGVELIKRVIALPNETVQIIDGEFVVDGERILDIENLDSPVYEGMASRPLRLLDGEYFVVGDNRIESVDSRYEEVGLVKESNIIGRVFVRLLPLKDFRLY